MPGEPAQEGRLNLLKVPTRCYGKRLGLDQNEPFKDKKNGRYCQKQQGQFEQTTGKLKVASVAGKEIDHQGDAYPQQYEKHDEPEGDHGTRPACRGKTSKTGSGRLALQTQERGRRGGRIFIGNEFPSLGIGKHRAQQAIVQGMAGFVPSERPHQGMPQQI